VCSVLTCLVGWPADQARQNIKACQEEGYSQATTKASIEVFQQGEGTECQRFSPLITLDLTGVGLQGGRFRYMRRC